MLSVFALTLAVACASPPPEIPGDRYTVRGEIRQIPGPEEPIQELLVRHEALPDFRNEAGEIVGMEAMTMPFPIADRAILDGLQAGDPVEMTFEMRWQGSPPLSVVALRRLDPSEVSTEKPTPQPNDESTEQSHAHHEQHGTQGASEEEEPASDVQAEDPHGEDSTAGDS